MRRNVLSEDGFTLIEMLVVIFIIGVIVAIALPNFMAAGEKAQLRADEANKKLIGAQADNYFLQYGEYPETIDELVRQGYLRSVPHCPGGKGKYTINRSKDIVFEERVTCKRTEDE